MAETLQMLNSLAEALKVQGNLDEAIKVHQQAALAYPQNGIAAHNLAAILGDAGRHEESAAHARRALSLGIRAAQTHLVLGRALVNSGELDEALRAYENACEIEPLQVLAQFERCQLIWMTTGDAEATLAALDKDIRRHGEVGALLFVKARVLQYTGDMGGACREIDTLARREPNNLMLLCQAASLLCQGGFVQRAHELAGRAMTMAPNHFAALEVWTNACLARGDAAGAADGVRGMLQINPDNQQAINLQAMVWRMTGDARFEQLYDFDRFVVPQFIGAPEGWTSRQAYLEDLASELKAAHPFRAHPFAQSVQHGSQRPDILSVQTPAIQAFRSVLTPLVNAYIEALGQGSDPLRRRIGSWKMQGIWSVWLQPGGFHTDHVHPAGWLSSAFYVELPDGMDGEGREGWIRFGESGISVNPHQPAQHWVRPELGMLVLFPSYMWHGTIPFGGEKPRLTMAMDIVPA